MPKVTVWNDNFEHALRRFKKKVESEHVLEKAKSKMYFEKPFEKRNRKKASAKARLRKQLRQDDKPKRLF